MKKRFLLMTMFVFILILSACSGDGEEAGDGSREPAETEDTAEETSGEDESADESGEESEISADGLIDAAQEEWGEADSYELNQVFMIDGGDEAAIRTITTHSDQDELKVEINHDNGTVTHYILDDAHYIYRGDKMELQEGTPGIEGTAYRDLIGGLDRYRSGEAGRTDGGYELTVQIEGAEDAEGLLSGEAGDMLGEAEDISGEIILTFDDEYRYTGAEMTASLVSGGEETGLSSTISIKNINNIPVIEKPSGM